EAYGFAGWRVGYMTYPDDLHDGMIKSQDTMLVCAPVASQVGAIAALDVGRSYSEPHVAELARIRDVVLSKLSALAPLASVPAADGAFYVLLKVDSDLPPMQITERLVPQHRLPAIPRPPS